MGEDLDVLQLWRACYCGNADLAQQLIEEDVDFLQRDRNGETVLHMAARSDNADVLNLLLDHLGPDVHNNNDQTALHLAASKGHIKVINVLLLADCDLDGQTKASRMTALHLACHSDRREVVSALLEGGAVCNVPDAIAKTPEFYTDDAHIHQLFTEHFKVCTHRDRGKLQASQEATPSAAEPKENTNTKQKKTASQTPSDESNLDWQGMDRKKIDNKFKKIKINHGLGFSAEHKKRMQANVFDRLLGGKKK